MLRAPLLILCALAGLAGDAVAQTLRSRSDALFEPWKATPARNSAHNTGLTGTRTSAIERERSPIPAADNPALNGASNLPARLQRAVVAYATNEPAGTIIVDTANTYLYLVLKDGQAVRYGIGVGREGFDWSGRERISRMAEWPNWHPPAEMLARDPDLPSFMPGGLQNPLGARALYLGDTLYRIHGTNEPASIGTYRSSGCIRMLNADIMDLYRKVSVGTQVLVLARNAEARHE